MLTDPFMQRALLAALFLGPLCALLGVFVTARRMAFFSDTISHAALVGVALGFWWGLHPTLPLVLFSLLVAAALIWLRENTELLPDTIMALLLSGSVALAIVIWSRMKGARSDLHRYLFGDILAVAPQDVWLAAGALAVIGVWLFWQLNSLTLMTAQEDMAHVCGIRVRLLNYVFVLVLTITVALSIQLLGIILVTSLLVVPAAAARNLSRTLRQQIVLSVLIGGVGAVGGTMLSYPLEVPCGPAIVLTCITIFLCSLAARPFLTRSHLARTS